MSSWGKITAPLSLWADQTQAYLHDLNVWFKVCFTIYHVLSPARWMGWPCPSLSLGTSWSQWMHALGKSPRKPHLPGWMPRWNNILKLEYLRGESRQNKVENFWDNLWGAVGIWGGKKLLHSGTLLLICYIIKKSAKCQFIIIALWFTGFTCVLWVFIHSKLKCLPSDFQGSCNVFRFPLITVFYSDAGVLISEPIRAM